MGIFSVIAIILLVVITLLLIKIYGGIRWIQSSVDKIEDMATMSDGQRYRYNREIDEPEQHQLDLEGEFWAEQKTNTTDTKQ